jgi:hypothetical protein
MDALLNPDFEIATTLRQRLMELYDAIVLAFDQHEVPLTQKLLETTIPGTLFHCAVLSEWLPDPHEATHLNEPVTISEYTVERHDAERFLGLLEGRVSFWLSELEADKNRVYEKRVQDLLPTKSDPVKDTPPILLQAYRRAKRQDNWKPLAKAAARLSMLYGFDAFHSAIYRILDGVNVNEETLRCLASVMSTPGQPISWEDLRWPKALRKRTHRKSANKK